MSREEEFKKMIERSDKFASEIAKAVEPVFGKPVTVEHIAGITYSKYAHKGYFVGSNSSLVVPVRGHWVQFTVGATRSGAKTGYFIGWLPGASEHGLLDHYMIKVPVTKTVLDKTNIYTIVNVPEPRSMTERLDYKGMPVRMKIKDVSIRNKLLNSAWFLRDVTIDGKAKKMYRHYSGRFFTAERGLVTLYNDVRVLKEDIGLPSDLSPLV